MPRLSLVLSAGGLRGAAHLGVLRRLTAANIPLDSIVGVSAGAVIAAYYAAVGLTTEELIDEAELFKGRHLVAHSLNLRTHQRLRWFFEPFAGVIPRRLRQLESCRFDQLHHGIRSIGVVCHDLTHNCPRYLTTRSHSDISLYNAVATSASIPNMFPPQPVEFEGQRCDFTDGGISDALPILFPQSADLDATHIIASDCRTHGDRPPCANQQNCTYIRPVIDGTTVLRAPRDSLLKAVLAGENAVTDKILDQIHSWTVSN